MHRAEDDITEHSQKIKIGGILKHLLDLWTVEDIFQACILCTFWICGRLKVDAEGTAKSITMEYGDIDVIDIVNEPLSSEENEEAKNRFAESNLSKFEGSSTIGKSFSRGEMDQTLKLTFDWIF